MTPDRTAADAPAIAIVPYARAHRDAVVALVLHVQNVEFGLGLPFEEQPDLHDIEAAFAGTGGGFWVALADAGAGGGRVVGTLGLQVRAGHDGAPWGVMKKFFVQSDHRGRAPDGGPGVGARLYDVLLAHARSAGLRGVVLDTPAVTERAHAFYARAGFRRIARDELPLPYDYPDRDTRLFRLDLTPPAARPS